MINWWAITTIGIWLSGAIATIGSKDCGCLMFSLIGSVLLGILWVMS